MYNSLLKHRTGPAEVRRPGAGVLAGIFTLLLAVLSSTPSLAACFVSATPISFGNYDVFSTIPTDTTGTITVACNRRTRVTVTIGPSPNSGTFNPRQMKLVTGTDLLNYNLFRNRNRTRIWGDGTGGTSVVRKRVRKKRPKKIRVFGRIPAGQNVSQGYYLDTVTVTVLP